MKQRPARKKEKPIQEMLKEIKTMIPYLIPLEKVGDFIFNSNINDYKSTYSFKYYKADDATEWDTYILENSISIYVEKDKIESIVCRDELIFKGRNIIGMKITEFRNYYNLQEVEEPEKMYLDDNEFQEVYEFDNIGLQVWCEDQVIVTVIATKYVNER